MTNRANDECGRAHAAPAPDDSSGEDRRGRGPAPDHSSGGDRRGRGPVSVSKRTPLGTDRRGFLAAVATAGGLAVGTPAVSAGMGHVGANAAEGGTEQWHHETGDQVRSSPTVVDGVVFVGSDDGHLYALDADGGEELWAESLATRVRSSPTVLGETAYVGTEDGDLFALDVADGGERWSVQLGSSISESVAVIEDTVYLANRESMGHGDAVLALDAADGSERWAAPMPARAREPIAVTEDVIVVRSDGLRVLERADGEERWHVPTDSAVENAMAVHDGVVYYGFLDGVHTRAEALDLEDGERLWSVEVPGRSRAATTAIEDLVFYATTEGLYALDVQDGAEQWRFEPTLGGTVRSAPTVAGDGVVVARDDDADGDDTGRIFERDLATGNPRWHVNPAGNVRSSATVVDGVAYVGAGDAVYAIETEGTASSEDARVELGILGHTDALANRFAPAVDPVEDEDDDSDDEPAPTADDEPPEETDDADGIPGFGVAAGVAALGGAAAMIARRFASERSD